MRQTCALSLCRDKRSIHARILNINLNGIGVASKRESCPGIEVGDRLILAEVSGAVPLEFIQDAELAIRWIGDNPMLEHVTFGCEFLDELPESARGKLSRLINTIFSNGLTMEE
jgi:hypothetical protein